MATLIRHFKRKRPLVAADSASQQDGEAQMEKCLTTFDLVSLGVGSCCGAGVYLTPSIIASEKAGPAGMISVLLAGLASILTGVHFAELAGICPYTSGSVYMYTYITVGELSAFLIGWGLIVEYVIGTAAAAVALGDTVHSLTRHHMANLTTRLTDSLGLPNIHVVSMAICLLLTWLLASGVQMSVRVNNCLNTLNLAVWAVFLTASFVIGSIDNWTEHDGFMPYGYIGVLSAIPTAYYAFIGFDALAATGAECKDPIKSLPRSLVLSIIINIIVFVGVVAGLTLDMPYNLLPSPIATLDVFSLLGYPILRDVVGVGAVAGLFAATFGSLFPLPRVLQSMAQDGLIFKYFAHVCPKRHTALRATVVSGVVAAFFAGFVELSLLIELVLIGTLLAYVIVTFATLVIRFVDPDYMPVSTNDVEGSHLLAPPYGSTNQSCSLKRKDSDLDLTNEEEIPKSPRRLSRQTSKSDNDRDSACVNGEVINKGFEDGEIPTSLRTQSSCSVTKRHESFDKTDDFNNDKDNVKDKCNVSNVINMYNQVSSVEKACYKKTCVNGKFAHLYTFIQQHLLLFVLSLYGSIFLTCVILGHFYHLLMEMNVVAVAGLALMMGVSGCMGAILMLVPQVKRTSEGYRAPFVPLTTLLTAAINIYIMTSLRSVTWLLFIAWMTIGLILYIVYGLRHSSMNIMGQVDLPAEGVKEEGVGATLESPQTFRENVPLLHQ